VPSDPRGTEFAPQQPDEAADAVCGKKGADDLAVSSDSEIPPYAAPVSLCLRFLPDRPNTHFCVQILDLATGGVLDELPAQPLDALPAVLRQTTRWVFHP